MVFNQGLVGPKVKLKSVADGWLVNIPALGYYSNALHSTYFWRIIGFPSLARERYRRASQRCGGIKRNMLSRKGALG